MSLARCKDHPPMNSRAAAPYTAFALPIGYPETAAVCGRGRCSRAACLWLTDAEQRTHAGGERIFSVDSHAIKVRVEGGLQKRI